MGCGWLFHLLANMDPLLFWQDLDMNNMAQLQKSKIIDVLGVHLLVPLWCSIATGGQWQGLGYINIVKLGHPFIFPTAPCYNQRSKLKQVSSFEHDVAQAGL